MFLFIVFALIAIVAGLGVILSRRPVYSALFLLLNFATLAAMYIMLQAQFLAAAQIIVYAGAIVVLFLFVVMLIGGGELNDVRDPNKPLAARLTWSRVTALVLAILLLAGLGYGLLTGQLAIARGDTAAFGQGSVQAIAGALYTDYLLPFELTSVLLLVGMIGAVVLARRHEEL
jgi:NADH-quinone oxidoreductase subunit J